MSNPELGNKFSQTERTPKTEAESAAELEEMSKVWDLYLALAEAGELECEENDGQIRIYGFDEDGKEITMAFVDQKAFADMQKRRPSQEQIDNHEERLSEKRRVEQQITEWKKDSKKPNFMEIDRSCDETRDGVWDV